MIGLRVAIENQERFSRIVLSNGGLPTGARTGGEAFMRWRELSRTMPVFDLKFVMQGGTATKISRDVIKGYEAPFPDETYKDGPRIMPSLVPISTDDPEHEANKSAIEQYKQWKKPFLTAFSDNDAITKGGYRLWQEIVPGAQGDSFVICPGHDVDGFAICGFGQRSVHSLAAIRREKTTIDEIVAGSCHIQLARIAHITKPVPVVIFLVVIYAIPIAIPFHGVERSQVLKWIKIAGK